MYLSIRNVGVSGCEWMCLTLVFKVGQKGWRHRSNKILPFARMDRIKARQQKYKKGKERMLSMTQESSEGPEVRKVSEEDDEGTISYCCTVIAVER